MSNFFISNTRLKLAKTEANAKQRPEIEYFLLENYSHHPRYHPKVIGHTIGRTLKIGHIDTT